jgi:hypothetical protein
LSSAKTPSVCFDLLGHHSAFRGEVTCLVMPNPALPHRMTALIVAVCALLSRSVMKLTLFFRNRACTLRMGQDAGPQWSIFLSLMRRSLNLPESPGTSPLMTSGHFVRNLFSQYFSQRSLSNPVQARAWESAEGRPGISGCTVFIHSGDSRPSTRATHLSLPQARTLLKQDTDGLVSASETTLFPGCRVRKKSSPLSIFACLTNSTLCAPSETKSVVSPVLL